MSSMTPDSTEPQPTADHDGRFASASARDPLDDVLDGLSIGQLQALIRARLHHDRGVRDALARAGAAMDPPALSAVLASQLGRLLDSVAGSMRWLEGEALWNGFHDWVADVGRLMLPVAPLRALELAERLIRSDAVLFESSSDRDDDAQELVRAACMLWLDAARVCRGGGEAAPWVARIVTLVREDGYGGRESLVSEAGRLLDGEERRALGEALR